MTTATKAKAAFQVTLDRDPLLAVVGRVRSVVERKGTIPILRNLLLEATKGRLSVGATDLDMEITDGVECDGIGSITVEADLLAGLLQKMPSGAECSLTFDDGDPRLILKCGRSRYQLPVLPASDFPHLADGGLDEKITVDTGAFEGLIAKTDFAISTEETRYYLNGLYLHQPEPGLMRAVATDSRRLALADMPAPKGYGASGIIIPRKAIREVTRLLAAAGENVTLQFGPTKFRLEAGDSILTSKVIDGSFPPYQRVIPDINPRAIVLDKHILAAALERAAVMNAERSVPTKLEFEAGSLRLTIRNQDGGGGNEEMETDYQGPAFNVGFNGKYLLEALQHVDDGKVEFRFADVADGQMTLDPCLILDPSNPAVKFVLMPLRA